MRRSPEGRFSARQAEAASAGSPYRCTADTALARPEARATRAALRGLRYAGALRLTFPCTSCLRPFNRPKRSPASSPRPARDSTWRSPSSPNFATAAASSATSRAAPDRSRSRSGSVIRSTPPTAQRIIEGHAPELMHNAQLEASVADLPATRELGIGAHVSVPIRFSSGRLYGTLCCFSTTPDESLTAREVEMLRVIATLIADQLEAEDQPSTARDEAVATIRAVMRDNVLRMVFQPIVRLADRSVLAVEALSRFDADPARPPTSGLPRPGRRASAPSSSCWRSVRHEQLTRSRARLPLDQPVARDRARSGARFRSSATRSAGRLVVEITEHANVAPYEPLRDASARARPRCVARDRRRRSGAFRAATAARTGARHAEGGPVDHPRRRRRPAAPFARDARSRRSHRRRACPRSPKVSKRRRRPAALRDLGIPLAQGYLFGRPGPLESFTALF